MNKFPKKISVIILSLAVFIIFSSPVLAVEPTNFLLKGVKCAQPASPTTVCGISGYNVAQPCSLCDFIKVGINLSDMVIAASGVLALAMFVYAGILYLTASIKPANAEAAKTAMIYAIVGLVFIFGAYTIVNFVFIALGGSSEMSALNKIYANTTGQQSWGACAEKATAQPSIVCPDANTGKNDGSILPNSPALINAPIPAGQAGSSCYTPIDCDPGLSCESFICR